VNTTVSFFPFVHFSRYSVTEILISSPLESNFLLCSLGVNSSFSLPYIFFPLFLWGIDPYLWRLWRDTKGIDLHPQQNPNKTSSHIEPLYPHSIEEALFLKIQVTLVQNDSRICSSYTLEAIQIRAIGTDLLS